MRRKSKATGRSAALQRVLTKIDEIAEATLRSVSLQTMWRTPTRKNSHAS
jgi:hypothetical protein